MHNVDALIELFDAKMAQLRDEFRAEQQQIIDEFQQERETMLTRHQHLTQEFSDILELQVCSPAHRQTDMISAVVQRHKWFHI